MASTETSREQEPSQASVAALLRLAEAALAAEDIAAARGHAGDILQCDGVAPDSADHARARLLLARCDVAVSRLERARTAAMEAAGVLCRHAAAPEEIAALALAARAAARSGRVVEAVEAGLLAVSVAESQPDAPPRATAYAALGCAYAAGQQFARAERALRVAGDIARTDADADAATRCDIAIETALASFARHAFARGDDAPAAAPDDLLAALAACRAIEEQWASTPADPARTPSRSLASTIAFGAALAGGVDESLCRLAAHGEPLRSGIGLHWSNALDALARAEITAHAGDLEAAALHAEDAASLAHAAQHVPLRALAQHVAAHCHERRGADAQALAQCRQSLQHERALRAADVESRSSSTRAALASRQHQIDVAALTARADRFQVLAYEDTLTGLPNLRRFEQALVEAIGASEDVNTPLCAAFIDCDRFKAINDAFGHELGNSVLHAVAAQIQQGVREGDFVARLHGDEFAIIFRNAKLSVAREVCQRIAAAIRAHDWAAMHPALEVAISIGVEQASRGDTAKTLMERADAAMFEIKAQRRLAQSAAAPTMAQVPEIMLRQVAHWLANAQRLVVFTGAGRVAPASPRDANDASPRRPMADRAPAPAADDVRAHWGERRIAMARDEPTPMHDALVGLARLMPSDPFAATFVTERIDGLLARAGAEHVIELYGNVFRDRCAKCGTVTSARPDDRCPACGRTGAFEPDVVPFGQTPEPRQVAGAELAAKRAEVILVVDTDAQVFPGAPLLEKARVRGARIVMVGTGPGANRSIADVSFNAPPDQLLDAVRARVASVRAGETHPIDRTHLSSDAFAALVYLSGHGSDHRGRTLEQTLAWTDQQIQMQSDSTQWQFPLMQRSPMCPEAPVVSVREFGVLASDAAARDGMRRAFRRMLAFYGFEWRDDRVHKAPAWRTRFDDWARSASGNDLRITRILTAMTHCGLQAEALEFLKALQEELPSWRDGDARRPMSFWLDAVRPRRHVERA